jgi:hypothetical protein
MPDLSTADISRALRERLREGGSWKVPHGKAARWHQNPIARRVLQGGMLVLLLSGGALVVVQANTRPPELASQVLDTRTQNRASTADTPELWLTPVATRDAGILADPRPATTDVAVRPPPRPPTPMPVPAPVIAIAPASGRSPAGGAITATTEHLGNMTVDAQLARAIAFGVEQRLEISVRADSKPVVGAHVSMRITNSFGTSVQIVPDTDRSGRSGKAWPTYRSVGLNEVRVLVSIADGREVAAQLAFLGASSDD